MKKFPSKQKIISEDNLEILNVEQIAARRVPVEDAEISLGKSSNWYCHFCKKKFSSEMFFLRHRCDAKEKVQTLASPTGQAAFGYYNEWLRQRRFTPQTATTFLESKLFKTFVKFAQMVIDANIAKPEKYISIMLVADLNPTMWCRSNAYSLYLDHIDALSDPMQEVQDSINYLFDLCEKEEWLNDDDTPNIKGVFVLMGVQRILSYLRQKRLSPWLLFCSKTFNEVLKHMDPSERSSLNNIINAEHWANKFKKNPQTVKDIVTITQALGL